MIRKILPLGLTLGAAAVVWAGSFAPRIGAVREPDGSVRAILGLPSNLVLGEPLPIDPALAASFSDQAGLVLVKGSIELLSPDGKIVSSYATGEPNAILDITDGPDTALAWLPSAGKFLRWNEHAFIASAFDTSRLMGSIRSVHLLDSAHADLLVSNDETLERICISIADGVPVRSEMLPESGEAAFQANSFLLFHDASGLELRGPDGARRTFSILQTDLVFEKSGKDWLHISSASAGQQWVLHLDARNPVLSELPGAPTAEAAPVEAAK
jgi:hypothetical protein